MPIRLKIPRVSNKKELVDAEYFNYGLIDGFFIGVLKFESNEIKMRIDKAVSLLWGWGDENINKRRFMEECKILWGYDLNLGKATFRAGKPECHMLKI